jgi:hypothetical protein
VLRAMRLNSADKCTLRRHVACLFAPWCVVASPVATDITAKPGHFFGYFLWGLAKKVSRLPAGIGGVEVKVSRYSTTQLQTPRPRGCAPARRLTLLIRLKRVSRKARPFPCPPAAGVLRYATVGRAEKIRCAQSSACFARRLLHSGCVIGGTPQFPAPSSQFPAPSSQLPAYSLQLRA